MNALARLLMGTTVVAAGPVAEAAPAGCTWGNGDSGGRRSGTVHVRHREVRVGISCLVPEPGDPFEVIQHCPWVGVGAHSSQACEGGSILVDAWIETR